MKTKTYPRIITELPEAYLPYEGFKAWILQGNARQVVFFDIDAKAAIPEHSHEELWGIVVEGELTLIISGEKRTYKKGDSYHIPAGTRHSAIFTTPCKVIDFFDGVDRYKEKRP